MLDLIWLNKNSVSIKQLVHQQKNDSTEHHIYLLNGQDFKIKMSKVKNNDNNKQIKWILRKKRVCTVLLISRLTQTDLHDGGAPEWGVKG